MKKYIIATALLAGLALNVAADVNVDWNQQFTNPVTTDGATPAPSSYLAVLLWSPDAVIDPLDPNDPLGQAGGALDQFLASQPLNGFGIDGPIIGAQTPYVFADDGLAGGFVFTRVFSSDTPTIGDLYGTSSNLSRALTVTTNDPLTLNPYEPLGIVVNNVIVPEPTTLALLGVGIGTILYRRRRNG